MGREIFFNSITIKPEEDTPRDLKNFAKTFHAGPGWNFLTGKPDDIELLRRALRFVDPNPIVDKDESRHSGMLRIGNEPYTLWASCQAGAKPATIAQEIGWVVRPTPLASGNLAEGCHANAKSS